MKSKFLTLSLLLTVMLASFSVNAQIETPRPSPWAKTSQAVGFAEVEIEYYRPSVKGRTIFGDLVPFDKLWRTGANASTKFRVSEEVTIEGKKLAAGEYSLFTIPGKEKWIVIFNKDAKAGTSTYSQEKDALRIEVKPAALASKVETFTINFASLGTDNATVELLWENTAVRFNLKSEVDAVVLEQIRKTLAGVSPNDYYTAARYYFDTGKDIKKANEWMDQAMSLMPEPKFWMLRQQALIKAEMGDYKAAMEIAQQSTKAAQEAGNEDYPALNEKSMVEWKGKMKGK